MHLCDCVQSERQPKLFVAPLQQTTSALFSPPPHGQKKWFKETKTRVKMQLLCARMSVLTFLNSFPPSRLPHPWPRLLLSLALCLVSFPSPFFLSFPGKSRLGELRHSLSQSSMLADSLGQSCANWIISEHWLSQQRREGSAD